MAAAQCRAAGEPCGVGDGSPPPATGRRHHPPRAGGVLTGATVSRRQAHTCATRAGDPWGSQHDGAGDDSPPRGVRRGVDGPSVASATPLARSPRHGRWGVRAVARRRHHAGGAGGGRVHRGGQLDAGGTSRVHGWTTAGAVLGPSDRARREPSPVGALRPVADVAPPRISAGWSRGLEDGNPSAGDEQDGEAGTAPTRVLSSPPSCGRCRGQAGPEWGADRSSTPRVAGHVREVDGTISAGGGGGSARRRLGRPLHGRRW